MRYMILFEANLLPLVDWRFTLRITFFVANTLHIHISEANILQILRGEGCENGASQRSALVNELEYASVFIDTAYTSSHRYALLSKILVRVILERINALNTHFRGYIQHDGALIYALFWSV